MGREHPDNGELGPDSSPIFKEWVAAGKTSALWRVPVGICNAGDMNRVHAKREEPKW